MAAKKREKGSDPRSGLQPAMTAIAKESAEIAGGRPGVAPCEAPALRFKTSVGQQKKAQRRMRSHSPGRSRRSSSAARSGRQTSAIFASRNPRRSGGRLQSCSTTMRLGSTDTETRKRPSASAGW